MQPAVGGQEGREFQVWAFAAIPKGDASSPRSVQPGKRLLSCLGKGSSGKPACSTFRAHPSQSWASLRALSTESLTAS